MLIRNTYSVFNKLPVIYHLEIDNTNEHYIQNNRVLTNEKIKYSYPKVAIDGPF